MRPRPHGVAARHRRRRLARTISALRRNVSASRSWMYQLSKRAASSSSVAPSTSSANAYASASGSARWPSSGRHGGWADTPLDSRRSRRSDRPARHGTRAGTRPAPARATRGSGGRRPRRARRWRRSGRQSRQRRHVPQPSAIGGRIVGGERRVGDRPNRTRTSYPRRATTRWRSCRTTRGRPAPRPRDRRDSSRRPATRARWPSWRRSIDDGLERGPDHVVVAAPCERCHPHRRPSDAAGCGGGSRR